MEQRTGSKFGKECIKAVYCHLAYLNYMQSTLCEMLGWMKVKEESEKVGLKLNIHCRGVFNYMLFLTNPLFLISFCQRPVKLHAALRTEVIV